MSGTLTGLEVFTLKALFQVFNQSYLIISITKIKIKEKPLIWETLWKENMTKNVLNKEIICQTNKYIYDLLACDYVFVCWVSYQCFESANMLIASQVMSRVCREAQIDNIPEHLIRWLHNNTTTQCMPLSHIVIYRKKLK